MRQTSITFNVKRGDVYLVHLGQGSGSEQAGTRPAVVIQNNIGNRYSSTTIVAAITSYKEREFMPTHVIVKPPFLNGPSIILLEQIFTLSKSKSIRPFEPAYKRKRNRNYANFMIVFPERRLSEPCQNEQCATTPAPIPTAVTC